MNVPYWDTLDDKKLLANVGVHIPDDSFVARKVFFDRRKGTTIEVGKNTTICEGTYILCHDASPSKVGLDTIYGSVKIGNNVFIGINCTILMGTTIGDNSIIGAGSVVTGTIPPNEVWAGNPARFIKTIEQFKNEHRRTGN